MLWLGYPRGHRLSLFQIKTASPDDDCICLFSYLFFHCGSFSYIEKAKKNCDFHPFLFTNVVFTGEGLESTEIWKNIYAPYFFLVNIEWMFAAGLVFYINTLKVSAWVCVRIAPVFQMSRNPERLNDLPDVTQQLGAGPQGTHVFWTLHQARCFSSVSTAQKKTLYIGVHFHQYSLTCLSTTYYKIHKSEHVISGIWANPAKHMQRGRKRRRFSPGTCLAWLQRGANL